MLLPFKLATIYFASSNIEQATEGMKKRSPKIRDQKCFQPLKIHNSPPFTKPKHEIISSGFKHHNIYIYGNHGNTVHVLYNPG